MSDEEFEMVMPFLTVASKGGPHDDQSYVAGFEMGHLDQRLADYACQYHEATIHRANLPQADLLAMRHGFRIKTLTDDSEWVTAAFTLIEVASD